jgi:hypothetical protein
MEEEAAAVEGTWGFHDTLPLSLAQQFSAAAGESAGEFWSLWEVAFNEAEEGGAAELFAEAHATLVLTAAGTAENLAQGSAAGVLTLTATGTAENLAQASAAGLLVIVATGSATAAIQGTGAGLLTLVSEATGTNLAQASGAGMLTLTGEATAENEVVAEEPPLPDMYGGWLGGAGREDFQPRFRRRPKPVLATAAATLVLTGRARAVTTPALGRTKVVRPAPTKPLTRPLEEAREFRLLARARGKLQLTGLAEAVAESTAEAHGKLTLAGMAEAVRSWPDDTDELVAIMLMVDQEAA